MQILFITSNRLGDAVLSTGLLSYMATKYSNPRVTIVCGALPASIFAGYPYLDDLIVLKKEKHHKHWLKLWQKVIGTRWDVAIDLRNSAVSRLIRAKKRYIHGRHIDKTQHKVLQNAQVINLNEGTVPAPMLWFTEQQEKEARNLIGEIKVPIIAIGPTANWHAKMWPAERFIALSHWLLDLPEFKTAKIAVFGAPNEEEGAYALFDALPEDRRIDVIAKADPGTAAAALSLCDYYIGNDSGLMHCAAAAGVKTLGLFGPSYPDIYRPWGGVFVRTPQTLDELIDYEGYDPKIAPCLMAGISLEMVQAAIEEHFLLEK